MLSHATKERTGRPIVRSLFHKFSIYSEVSDGVCERRSDISALGLWVAYGQVRMEGDRKKHHAYIYANTLPDNIE